MTERRVSLMLVVETDNFSSISNIKSWHDQLGFGIDQLILVVENRDMATRLECQFGGEQVFVYLGCIAEGAAKDVARHVVGDVLAILDVDCEFNSSIVASWKEIEMVSSRVYIGSVATRCDGGAGANDWVNLTHLERLSRGREVVGVWATFVKTNVLLSRKQLQSMELERIGYISSVGAWLHAFYNASEKGVCISWEPNLRCETSNSVNRKSEAVKRDFRHFKKLNPGPAAATSNIVEPLFSGGESLSRNTAIEALNRFEVAYLCSVDQDVTRIKLDQLFM